MLAAAQRRPTGSPRFPRQIPVGTAGSQKTRARFRASRQSLQRTPLDCRTIGATTWKTGTRISGKKSLRPPDQNRIAATAIGSSHSATRQLDPTGAYFQETPEIDHERTTELATPQSAEE